MTEKSRLGWSVLAQVCSHRLQGITVSIDYKGYWSVSVTRDNGQYRSKGKMVSIDYKVEWSVLITR